jgi:hypothetical protein
MADINTFYPPARLANLASAVDDQNSASDSLIWTGTAAQYAAIGSKDANTLYFVTP